MAVTNRFSAYPCTLVGGSTITLRQIHGVGVQSGTSKDIIIPAGDIDPSAIPGIFGDPRVSLATYDLATAMTISATTGHAITASSVLQYQARTDRGTFEGSGAHVTLSMTKGFAMLSGISASQDGPAECGITLFPLYDGTNQPLVCNTAQNLTSTPTFISKFYMGPVTVNGAAINGVIATSVNPGIDFRPNRQDGDVWARVGAIYTRVPTISVTTTDLTSIGTIGSLFNASLPGTVNVFYSKGSSGGHRVASASTVHFKASAAAGVWSAENLNVSNNDDGSVTVTMHLTGAAALSCVTNSALP